MQWMYHSVMPEPQSFKNHTRFDPPFHFIAIPILLANLIACIVATVKIAIHAGPHLGLHIWLTIVSFALLLAVGNGRGKDLRVQDRVIRLEERLRYAALLSPTDLAASAALTVRQIVALRFASDAELPALVARTLAENLEPKQIKQSIVSWRADNHRV
jgi:hypothetical protein